MINSSLLCLWIGLQSVHTQEVGETFANLGYNYVASYITSNHTELGGAKVDEDDPTKLHLVVRAEESDAHMVEVPILRDGE